MILAIIHFIDMYQFFLNLPQTHNRVLPTVGADRGPAHLSVAAALFSFTRSIAKITTGKKTMFTLNQHDKRIMFNL